MADERDTKKLRIQGELKDLLGGWLPKGFYTPLPGQEEWIARIKGGVTEDTTKATVAKPMETEAQADKRIAERFKTMDMMTQMCIAGESKAMIVFGGPGLGKSHNIEMALKKYDPKMNKWNKVTGAATTVNLVKQLWDARRPGNILFFDDCDSIWENEASLNILKAATDSKGIRRVSYLSEGTLISDKDQSRVGKSFEFEGTIIFITNKNLDQAAAAGGRNKEHFMAMMSRSDYIDLTLTTRRDFMVRINQVLREGVFLSDLKPAEKKDVMDYVIKHQATLRSLDLRTVEKIGRYRQATKEAWETMAKVTCFRAGDFVEETTDEEA